MTGHNGRWRLAALFGGLASMALAGPAWADPAPPFAQLLKQAEQSPRVLELDADVDRAEGLSEQARARPNPSVSIYL